MMMQPAILVSEIA